MSIGIIARHVRDQQRHDFCREARRGEPPTLDGREVAAQAVHLADRRPGLQQRAVQRLLVLQRQSIQWQRQQRRGAAGHQAQHQIVSA